MIQQCHTLHSLLSPNLTFSHCRKLFTIFDRKMASFTGLEKLGLIFVATVLVHVVRKVWGVIYTYALGPSLNKVDFKSKGKWALITGATDGIGKEYARQLAAKGCDVILVSRTLEKLKAVAQEIEKEFNVTTKVVQADFSEGNEIYTNIAKEIEGLEIGTLVNNVGVSYIYPEYFLDIPDGEKLLANIINTNMVSVTKMTSIVLPGMVKRGSGVIINIGSASSDIPSPLLTLYAASKAYVDKFTDGLRMEYQSKGIIIQSVLPGFVCSNMSGIRRSTLFAPTAKTFVKSAIGLVGTATKTTGYLPHAFFTNLINAIQWISDSFSTWLVIRNMENIRARTLKKYKKQ